MTMLVTSMPPHWVISPQPLCGAGSCQPILVTDLLDRAAKVSHRLHALSTAASNDLNNHFAPALKLVMMRPLSLCHTSSLNTPEDKEQVLQLSQEDLLTMVALLLKSWGTPLLYLVKEAQELPHPANDALLWKMAELSQQTENLARGIDKILNKLDPTGFHSFSTDLISPWSGGPGLEMGSDKKSHLLNFHFLLSCFRRDSNKIDSFVKLLRCRATKMNPESC
ncbi:prolactin [Erpetoichthys calabaricus]|uniref:Prolactin-like n=1 Tax=Erpetoichthys calabaricus TaxID=27687 RepID=A0A8C4SAW9_ERPCA|nr:prolactin [Erpetoichthys calabaricus]XP_028669361.1 prolactin [Erpetoichthys calabaricus]